MEHGFIKDITDYIFIEDELEKSDVIFIPGSMCYLLPEKAAELYRAGMARYIIPSGKYSVLTNALSAQNPTVKYNGEWSTEAEFFAYVLRKNGVDKEAVIPECESMYTYQNVLFTKALTDRLGIKVERAILCCKAYHARRAYTYYKREYPDAEILVCPCDKENVGPDNWYKTEKGIRCVSGELRRISEQLMPPTDSETQAHEKRKNIMRLRSEENIDE